MGVLTLRLCVVSLREQDFYHCVAECFVLAGRVRIRFQVKGGRVRGVRNRQKLQIGPTRQCLLLTEKEGGGGWGGWKAI